MTINRDLANLVPTITQSGGNVGVGVSPSTKLTVSGANTASRGQLSVVGASDSARITLYQDSTFNGIFQSSNTETDIGTTSATPIKFLTNSTERLRIPSNAGGIQFPATQVASSNANTLDDYEEGSWTPADGSGAGLSITNSGATYIKVGRLVTIFAFIAYPATANGSNASISGLPFALSATEYGEIIARTTAAITAMIFQPNAGGTVGAFQLSASNTNVTNNQLSGASILFCGSYFASS